MSKTLRFQLQKKCSATRARCAILSLVDIQASGQTDVETPVFMPVGTAGTMKGILPEQLEATGCRLMLSNTYHLSTRPGADVVEKAGGLHTFMNWPHTILIDSGGFQMVSLSKLTKIAEEGVVFQSPYNPGEELNMTPEQCVDLQNKIGANIIMQLDDVVHSCCQDKKRVEEAGERSARWFGRCQEMHKKKENKQTLFPIIQGGLDSEFRKKSVEQLLAHDPLGIAIGGLSGGEAKEDFVRMVACSTEHLPEGKPRYLMGVGAAIDMLMAVALGCDMFDCVYPTRTARFGFALVGFGSQLPVKNQSFATDFTPISDECDCQTCQRYTRAYIHHLMRYRTTVGCHLLTVHNIRFQMRFMNKIRQAIFDGKFVQFIGQNLKYHFGTKENYPKWILEALRLLNLDLNLNC